MKKLIIAFVIIVFATLSFSDTSIAGEKRKYRKAQKQQTISRVEKPVRQQRPALDKRVRPDRVVRQQTAGGHYKPGYKPGNAKPDRHYYKKHRRHNGGTWNYNYSYEYENKTKFYNDPYFWGSVAGVVGGIIAAPGPVYAEPGPVYAEPICETYWVDYYDRRYGMWTQQPVQDCR